LLFVTFKEILAFYQSIIVKKVMRRSGTACGDHNPRAIDRVNGVERKKIWQLDF
jgi:hypothetical protein